MNHPFRQQPKQEPSGIQHALRAWQDTQKYFELVSDPDLVDVAIYDMEAARRRYMYMLKQLRKETPKKAW